MKSNALRIIVEDYTGIKRQTSFKTTQLKISIKIFTIKVDLYYRKNGEELLFNYV